MSKMLMCVIKDTKTGGHQNPFCVPSLPDLFRSLELSLKQNPQSLIAQFPGDYELWQIADWDAETGILSCLFDKDFICSIAQVLNRGLEKKEIKNG